MLKLSPPIRRTLLVILVVLVALPWLVSDIARYLVVDQLQQRGIDRVDIEEFWLNPYSAQVALTGVTLHHEKQAYQLSSLKLELSWRDLWAKKIRIIDFKLAGLDLHLQKTKDQVFINGLNLSSDDVASNDAPEPNDLDENSAIDQWHFAIDNLSIDTVKLQWQDENSAGSARLKDLALGRFDTKTAAKSEFRFSLLLDELSLQDKMLRAAAEIHYTASIELQRDLKGVWSSSLLGNLTVDNARLITDQLSAELSTLEAGLMTRINLTDRFSHSTQVEMNLSDVSLLSTDDNRSLLNFDRLSFVTQVQDNAVDVDNLVLAGINVFPDALIENVHDDSKQASPLIEGASLHLDHLRVNLASEISPLSVVAEKLSLAAADIYIDRNVDGDIVQLASLERFQQRIDRVTKEFGNIEEQQSSLTEEESQLVPSASKDVSSTDHKDNRVFRLERFTVESEVALHFKDHSVKPRFSEDINVDFIDIENISLNEPMAIGLKFELSHGATLAASANASILDPQVKGSLELQGYELLKASGYSEIFTGYALESGQLSLASDFSVENNLLTSLHTVDIDQLNLRAEHQDSITKLTHQLTMPLDQAVDLLRDGKNHIHLEIPVTGELNNPNVDLQQIVNTALKGAMKKASLAMLSALLQPYGAMISIAQMAGEEMTKVRLESVNFAQGQADVDLDSIDYASKVGAMIKARPSLKIKLCGLTNLEDLNFLITQNTQRSETMAVAKNTDALPQFQQDAFREELQQLGLDRALSLKSYFQNQIGISESQLMMCLPKHSVSSISGVELSI